MSDIKDEAQRRAEEQRDIFNQMMLADMERKRQLAAQADVPIVEEEPPVLPPPVIPQGQEGGYVPMDTPSAIPSTSMYDEQPFELPLGAQFVEQELQRRMEPVSPDQGMLRPMPTDTAIPYPEEVGEGPGLLPDIGAGLKSGFLDVASVVAGVGAMVGEFGRRITGREDPFEFQQALADKYMDLSQQSALVKRDMNDPWETAKGLFGQSDEVGIGQAAAHMPATIVETFANQAPFMAMTMGVGGLFSKAFGAGIARMAAQGGKAGLLGKRSHKFMLDEGMRGVRASMTKAAWKKANKQQLRDELESRIGKEIQENAINAYGARMGMNSGIVAGTGALEAGGMFGEAYEVMGGMDNISLASTALFGTAAGLVELSLGGGNLAAIRRHLGPKAEKEALAIARRAAVADAAEIPALSKKATHMIRRVAEASGVEALQETAQEMAAITNLVYNAPESIQDMDILERLGSAAVVGGMMGFGPGTISEFADFRQGRKPDEAAGGEDVSSLPGLKYSTVLPQNLRDSDIEVLKKFGRDLYDDLSSVETWTDEEKLSLQMLQGSTEGFDGLNYQNPEFLLEFFVNAEKGKGNSPMQRLQQMYGEQGRNDWDIDRTPWNPLHPDFKPPTQNPHVAREEEHQADVRAKEAEATEREKQLAGIVEAQKARNRWRNVWKGGYKKAQIRDLKNKNTEATDKFISNLVGRNTVSKENPEGLPVDYEWRNKTHDEVFLDVLQLKAPLENTLDASGMQELNLLRDNAGNLVTALPTQEAAPVAPEAAGQMLDPATQIGRTTEQLYQVSPETALPGPIGPQFGPVPPPQFGPVPPALPDFTPGEMTRAEWENQARMGQGAVVGPKPTKIPRKKRKKKAKPAATKPAAKPTTAVPEVEGTITKREDDGAYVVKSKEGGILGVVATEKEANELLGAKPPKPTLTKETAKPAAPAKETKPKKTKPVETDEEKATKKILSRQKKKTPLTDEEKATYYTPVIEAAGLKTPRKGSGDAKWDARLREARRGGKPKKKSRRQQLIALHRQKTGETQPQATKQKTSDLEEAYGAELDAQEAAPPAEETKPTKPTLTKEEKQEENKEDLKKKAAEAAKKKKGKPSLTKEEKTAEEVAPTEEEAPKPGEFRINITRGDSFKLMQAKVLGQIAEEEKKVKGFKAEGKEMIERKKVKVGKLGNLKEKIKEQTTVEGIMDIISRSSIASGMSKAPAKQPSLTKGEAAPAKQPSLTKGEAAPAEEVAPKEVAPDEVFDMAVSLTAIIKNDLQNLNKIKIKLNSIENTNGRQSKKFKEFSKVAGTAFKAMLKEAETTPEGFFDALTKLDKKAIQALPFTNRVTDLFLEVKKQESTLKEAREKDDYKKLKGFEALLGLTIDNASRELEAMGIDVDRAAITLGVEKPKPTPPPKGKGPTLTTPTEIEKKAEEEASKASSPPTITGEEDEKTKITGPKLTRGDAAIFYDEEGNPIGYNAEDMFTDPELNTRARPILSTADGDTITTTHIDLSRENGYDLDLIQEGRGVLQQYTGKKKESPKKETAKARNARLERLLTMVGREVFDRIMGEGAADKLLDSGTATEVSAEDVDIGTPRLTGLGQADIYPATWKQFKTGANTVLPNGQMTDYGAEILLAFMEEKGTFTSERLDELIYGTKGPGRPMKAEKATPKTQVYSAVSYPTHDAEGKTNRFKNDPYARKVFDEERANASIEQWLKREFEANLKTPTKNPRIKALIDRGNKLFSMATKRSIAGIYEPRAETAGGFKTAPYKGASEAEKSQLSWIDEQKAKDLIDTVGAPATFFNFYKLFIDALTFVQEVARTNKKEAKEILDERGQRLDSLRRMFGHDPNMEGLLKRKIKTLETPADKQLYGQVRDSSDFLDMAIATLISGTPPQDINPGVWSAILDITAKTRGLSLTDTKIEYGALQQYVFKLAEVAKANGVAGDVVTISTRKRKSKYDKEIAKALGLDKHGYKVRVFPPNEAGFMKGAKEDDAYSTGDPQYGWRLQHGMGELHVIEGLMINDKLAAKMVQSIMHRKIQTESPELSAEHKKLIEEQDEIATKELDILQQLHDYRQSWIAEYRTKTPKETYKYKDAEAYAEKKTKTSMKYKSLQSELKAYGKESAALTEKLDKFLFEYHDKGLKMIEEARKMRLEELASEVTDKQVTEVMRDPKIRKRFKDEFSRLVINPKTLKKWNAEDWGRENYQGRKKWTADMFRTAIAMRNDALADKVGQASANVQLDGWMKQPFFRDWWKATEGDPKYKGRETWDDFQTKGKEILVQVKDLRTFYKEVLRYTPARINEAMKGVGKKPVKITLFRESKLDTETKIAYINAAMKFKEEQYKTQEGSGGKAKHVRNKVLTAKQLREAEAKWATTESKTRVPMSQMLTTVRNALKKVKDIEERAESFKKLTPEEEALLSAEEKQVRANLKKKKEVAAEPILPENNFSIVETESGEEVAVDTEHVIATTTQQLKDYQAGKPGIVPPKHIIMAAGVEAPTPQKTEGVAADKDTGDIQMLEGLVEQNEDFIREFYDRYATQIEKAARGYLQENHKHKSGDVTNTVFMSFLGDAETHLKKFTEGEAKNLKSYVNGITRNAAKAEMMGERFGITKDLPAEMGIAAEQEGAILAEEYAEEKGLDIEGAIEKPEFDEAKERESRLEAILRRERAKQKIREAIHKDPLKIAPKILPSHLAALQLYTFYQLTLDKRYSRDDAWLMASSVKESTAPLSKTQQVAKVISSAFGVPLHFVDSIDFGGTTALHVTGSVYMDASKTGNSAVKMFGHEFFHALEYYAASNPAFAKVFKKANEKIYNAVMATDMGRDAWDVKRQWWVEDYAPSKEKELGRKLTEKEIDAGTWREFKADLMGESLMSENFYTELQKVDPSLYDVVRGIVRGMWDKIVAYTKALVNVRDQYKITQGETTEDAMDRYNRLEALYRSQDKWMRDSLAVTPGQITEVAQAMALLASEAANIHNVSGNIVYLPGDQKLTATKIRGSSPTFDSIAHGLLTEDQNAIPPLLTILGEGKYSIATIKHNIRAALGRKVHIHPNKYAAEYGAALRRMDVILYPEAYGRDSDEYNTWLRKLADVDVNGKPFKAWFGDSAITNSFISKKADNAGSLVKGFKLFKNQDGNAPAVMLTTTATNSFELLQPQYAMAEWTNDRGDDQFAYFASVHPDGAIDFKADHKTLEAEEHMIPVYVKSVNPFDPANVAHHVIMEEWLKQNYDSIQEDTYDKQRIVPSLFTNSEFLKFLDNRGFDSVVAHSGGLHLVVFNSSQLKSATDNNGLYLSTDSGVNAAKTGEDGRSETGPRINALNMDAKNGKSGPRNHRKMAHWRFPERALREWAKRDEIDPNAVTKILGIFPTSKADAKWYHEILANPWHLREIFKKFKETHTVEVRREEARMEFVHRHSQSIVAGEAYDTEKDTRHPFYVLPKKERIVATQALQLGDKYGHQLTTKDMLDGSFYSAVHQREVQLPKLNRAQREAIHAVRQTLNDIWAERIEEMKSLILRPYHKTATYLPLKEALEKYWKEMKMSTTEDENLIEQDIIEHPSADRKKEILQAGVDKLAGVDHQAFINAFNTLTNQGGKVEQIFDVNQSWGKFKGYFPRMRKTSDYVAEIWTGTKDNKQVIWSYRPTVVETGNILKKGKSVFEYATLEKYMRQDKNFGPLLESGRAKFELRRNPQLAEDMFSEVSGIDTSGIIRTAIDTLQRGGKMEEDVADKLYESVFQQVTEQFKARGFGRHSIKRGERFIPGFREGDGAEILNDYITGAAGFMTKQRASYEFYKSLEKIDPKSEKKLFKYARDFVNNMLRNTEQIDHQSAKLRGIMFTMFLAGSLKPVVVNFTQNFVAGIPWLSKVAGVKDAHRLYLKAMKDTVGLINPINIFNPKGKPTIDKGNLTQEEWHYMERAIFQGRTIDQFVRELSESFRTGRTWYHKTANYLARGFSHMEQFNRASAHLAMFRWAREQGINPEQADTLAEDFVYNTHYLIGKSNLPQWAMGPSQLSRLVGRNALLFRGFTHNYLLSMVRSLAKGENGKRDYTTVLVSIAYIGLFGGLLSVPFLDDLIEMIEKITKKPLRSKARKLAYESGYESFWNAAALGVPSTLGFEMSGSMAITMPWGVDDAVFGVWGGLGSKLVQASKAMDAEDYTRALENLMPMFASHPMRAYRSHMYPVTTPSGQVLYDWEGEQFQYTTTQALWRALGFRPTREAVAQMDRRSKDLLLEMMRGVRTNFYRQYAIAFNKGDKAGMKRAREKGREWNRDVRIYGLANKLGLTSYETFEQSRKRKREGRKKELMDE